MVAHGSLTGTALILGVALHSAAASLLSLSVAGFGVISAEPVAGFGTISAATSLALLVPVHSAELLPPRPQRGGGAVTPARRRELRRPSCAYGVVVEV